ncbi:MAG: hypothetical protein GY698_00745 [Actinomycetia bacterium]|nr:hypothetical protein [Actinomycetes bacterium]
MAEHDYGALRFEPTGRLQPRRRWVVVFIAVLAFVLTAVSTRLLLPERWTQTAYLNAPESVPAQRVGVFVDGVQTAISGPSSQADAAQSVGVDSSKIDVTVERTELDEIQVELIAPSLRQGRDTLLALVQAGFGSARADELAEANQRFDRAVSDERRAEAENDIAALTSLEGLAIDDEISIAEQARSNDWAVVVSISLTFAAITFFVVSHIERGWWITGHERTVQAEINHRARCDPTSSEPEPGATHDISTPPTVQASGSSVPPVSRQPVKHHIPGLDQHPTPPRSTEPGAVARTFDDRPTRTAPQGAEDNLPAVLDFLRRPR